MNVSTRHKRFFQLIMGVIIATSSVGISTSCSERMICPAYQSAFIFDTTALKRKFSYFINDTPKINKVVSKNKFLLVEPLSYRKTLASFRTIEMLPIYPVIPDSLRFQADNILLGDLDIKDSTGQTPIHPGLVGIKFNVEQENYMYYFRKILVLPDVRAGAAERAKANKKRKGPIQWVKNLFKRDKKEEPEQVAETATDPNADPTEKKGFFSRLKGKKKGEEDAVDSNQVQEPVQPAVEDPAAPPKKSFFQKLKDKFKKKDKSAEPPKPEKKPADKKDDGF